MKFFNAVGYLSLTALAVWGLVRLYTEKASFSWILTIFYGGIAAVMLGVNVIRWGFRRATPNPLDDHKFIIVTRVWAYVALLSTVYCAAALAISYFVRHSNALATLYGCLALGCLVVTGVSFLGTRSVKRRFSPVV